MAAVQLKLFQRRAPYKSPLCIWRYSTKLHHRSRYLTDGFWAYTKDQELQAQKTASFLERMEDVSDIINAEFKDDMDAGPRTVIAKMADSIENATTRAPYLMPK